MSKSKSRGRPSDPGLQEMRKNQLINAASELLKSKSYRSITIREVAEKAGTQSAMVSYYFGNKEGLFMAMFEAHADRELVQLQKALTSSNPLLAFIQTLLKIFSESPHISRLLVDEVLTRNGEMQRRFIDILPRRMAKLLPSILSAQQDLGLLRKDLDPKWAAFSLMTMLITPFVAKPVREAAWTISDEDLAGEAWAQHIYNLFLFGVGGDNQ
ncbi:TetR family transcriptional regulator [Hahella sp. CCB-MM4]|uniref:TetR/AcrR family transcriptional regulator n=1 Tax=Hahella sp. (strain CCB-MM4) TaxID=1926491 RepID=UPI000B9A389B|nr:TetR/AcrR family transcriptional regulator [Hahella sp. CCB-MM4]OZG75186.1 TetR family transcriptional regulator [Hahella sp. CCB-MM4]